MTVTVSVVAAAAMVVCHTPASVCIVSGYILYFSIYISIESYARSDTQCVSKTESKERRK